MARKKKPEEHENHERWLVSYADFITLLFAFFVVMYSISSVNEGKYRVLSNSLITAFGTPVKSLQPIQVGNLVRSNQKTIDNLKSPPSAVLKHPDIKGLPKFKSKEGDESADNADSETPSSGPADGSATKGDDAEQLQAMAQEIQEALKEFVEQGLVTVKQDDVGVKVEVNSHVLFSSGSSLLSESATPVLKDIAAVLENSDNEIHVEGFTDSIPISTMIYPSNWELSAARSATVVRLFAGYQIQPERMVSVGYGEYRPIADNETPEGRAKNRRVVVVVLAKEEEPSLMETGIPRGTAWPESESGGDSPFIDEEAIDVEMDLGPTAPAQIETDQAIPNNMPGILTQQAPPLGQPLLGGAVQQQDG